LTQKKALPASFLSLLLVALALVLLAVLPGQLQKKHYSLQLPDGRSGRLPQFPVDTQLPLIEPVGKTGTISIRSLIGENPNGALICFWATWCPPCLEELPSLEYFGRQLNQAGNAFPKLITVSVDESPNDVFSLYKTLDFTPTLVVLHDRAGEFSRSLGTTKFPETYWVDPSGTVLHKWIGPQNWLSQDIIQKLHRQPKG